MGEPRILDPLPPPVALFSDSDAYRRSALSRSGKILFGRTEGKIPGEKTQRLRAFPSLERSSSLPAADRLSRTLRFQDTDGRDWGNFVHRPVPSANSPRRHKVGAADDVCPAMRALQDLKRLTSVPAVKVDEKDEGELSAELAEWVSTTLASLPTKKTPARATQASLLESMLAGSEETKARVPSQNASRQKILHSDGVLPNGAEVLQRLRRGEGGFSKTELSWMKALFDRFRIPNTADVHRDDLQVMMERLGYMLTDTDTIQIVLALTTKFSTLNFSEFTMFAENLTVHEIEQFRRVFMTFDGDSSGRLSFAELRHFMVRIGITPLRAQLKEAMALVGLDPCRSLDFTEAEQLLAVYRHCGGFTSHEVRELYRLFEKEVQAAGSEELPADKLADILMGFFGPQSMETARRMQSEVMAARSNEDSAQEQRFIFGLKFPEALLWARRLRESEIEVYRKTFHQFDKDGSNSIDLSELQDIVSALGYNLVKSMIDEVLMEAQDDYAEKKEGHLDFDEFVNLMFLFRRWDGFSRAEVQELRKTFKRFDDNGNGEVETIELCDILRYLGYITKMDEVQLLIAKVDANESGTLDFRELLRLLRLHREEQLVRVRKTFNLYKDKEQGRMPFSSVPFALAGLGYQYTRRKEDPVGKEARAIMIDFDGLIEIVDRARAHRVTMQRRCAGFTESEVSRFREMFERYDHDGNGNIEPREAGMFVEELGFTINTFEERRVFLADIERARETATLAGVEDIGTPGGSITFWVLVQVLRVLYKRDDNIILANELRAAKEADFEQGEVDGFRCVFMDWFSQDKKFQKEAAVSLSPPSVADLGPPLSELHNRGRPSSGRPSSVLEGTSNRQNADRRATPPPGATEEKELSKDSIRRLLRSMGLTVTKENTCKLERKIDDLDSSGRVDFADFLRLMRWMLSTNFADINSSSVMAARESKA